MKKILALILSAILCFSAIGTVYAAEMNFTDVKASDWFYNDVRSAVEMGLINGKSPTTYAPNDNLTYAEAIKLAACMHQLYNEGAVTLASGNPWYKPYADYCVTKGIIDKEYNYNDNATRAGYMGIFAKALPDEGLKAINNVPDNSIPDVPSSRAYAAGVYKLYRAGILQGVDDAHNCNPLANITRAEVAAILTRMMNETKRVKFSMANETPSTGGGAGSGGGGGAADGTTGGSETPATKALAIITQPTAITIEVGETGTLSVEAEGGKAPYSYQWQLGANGTTYQNAGNNAYMSGTKTDTISVKENKACYVYFRCVITDADGNKVTSDGVKVTVKEAETAKALAIKTQPAAITIRVGETGKLSVEAEGGKAPYSYQWQLGDSANATNYTNPANNAYTNGVKTNTLSVKSNQPSEGYFRCVITDADGNKVTSNAVKVTVEEAAEPIKALAIVTQPTAITIEVGETGTLSVEAEGGKVPYSYQWQLGVNETTYQNAGNNTYISGANTDTISVKENKECYVFFRCIITDADGNKVTSNGAKVTVVAAETAKPLAITSQSESSNATYGAGIVTLEVEVEGGKAPYTYQWYRRTTITLNGKKILRELEITDDGSKTVGAKTAALKRIHESEGTYSYVCKVTDADGNTVKSEIITVTCDTEATGGRESIPTGGKNDYLE